MTRELARYSRFPRHRARRKDNRDSYCQLETAGNGDGRLVAITIVRIAIVVATKKRASVA
jgi:hypothetical protein